ncbi:MAG TPA: glycosyltransferase family A protein [Polyangiales bacterium]
MTTQPRLVSIIIPAFNARATVREAVESALNQTYRQIEVIVIDDASTDGTLDVISDLALRDSRLRLIRQERNAGAPASRNRAIWASRGEYLAFLDADDVWHPEKLALQVAKMDASGPEVGVVYSWCTYMDWDGFIIPNRVFAGLHEGDVYAALLEGNFINNTWLVRRSCLETIGGYRAELAIGNEDLQIYLDLAERYDFVVVPEFLSAYRLNPTSKSHDVWGMKRGHEAVLSQARARHPELPGWLLRWSASNQSFFLAFQCLRSGRWLEGLQLVAITFARDPGFFARPFFWGIIRRALARTLGKAPAPAAQPKRRFLDGGPPPKLNVPPNDSPAEQERRRRVAEIKVRQRASDDVRNPAWVFDCSKAG